MRWPGVVVICACVAGACATQPSPAKLPAPLAPRSASVAAAELPPPIASAPAIVVSAEPASEASEVPTVALRSWRREREEPLESIAVGKNHVAALTAGSGSRAVWLREGAHWRELPIPSRMLAAGADRDSLRLWFGRDDRPRIMGTRHHADGSASMVYLRWKGDWRDKPGEIGRLDKPPEAALFGILGDDDPEVVCKLGDVCIIKRITGWTTIGAPSERLRVELAGKSAVGVGETSAWQLGPDAWAPLAATVPWQSPPAGIWANASGGVWVAEPARDRLHHWDGKTWSAHASPCTSPQALWGSAPTDVYLAAAGGAAHWDGLRWSRLSEPTGSFADIRADSEGALWLAGPTGLWRGFP